MRNAALLYVKSICWPALVIYYGMVLCFVNVPIGEQYVIFGLDNSVIEGVDYLAFSRWLLLMCAPLVVNGVYLERVTLIDTFIYLRTGKMSRFNTFMIVGTVISSSLWAICLFFLAVHRSGVKFASLQLILSVTNYSMWSTAQVLLYLLSARASWSGILVIGMISGAYLVGEYLPGFEKYSPALWGMLYRSNIYHENGYSLLYMTVMNVAVFAILVCISGTSFVGKYIHGRKM